MKTINPVVIEVTPVNEGCMRALVTIQIGPLVIYKVRWIQQPNQRGYASPPQEQLRGADGRLRYVPLLKWPAEWQQTITAAILEAIRDHPNVLRQFPTIKAPSTEFGQEVHRRAGIGGQQ